MKQFITLIFCMLSSLAIQVHGKGIVTLSPHATELVFFAGAIDQLAGRSAFSDYPEEITSLPVVGDATGINRELILKLQPDLVIAWKDGIKSSDQRWLESQAIPLQISNPQTPEAISSEIVALGAQLGTATNARIQAANYLDKLEQLNKIHTDNKSEKRQTLNVTHQLWNKPLMVLTDESMVARVLKLCGMENPVHIEGHSVSSVTREYIYQLEADAILIDKDAFFEAFNPNDLPVLKGDTLRLHRPTPRIADAAIEVCLQAWSHFRPHP